MRQINATIVSDNLVRLIETVDTEDKWLEQKANISDSVRFIVRRMSEGDFKDSEAMFEWTSVLQLLSEYQEILDIFHHEHTLSPRF